MVVQSVCSVKRVNGLDNIVSGVVLMLTLLNPENTRKIAWAMDDQLPVDVFVTKVIFFISNKKLENWRTTSVDKWSSRSTL